VSPTSSPDWAPQIIHTEGRCEPVCTVQRGVDNIIMKVPQHPGGVLGKKLSQNFFPNVCPTMKVFKTEENASR